MIIELTACKNCKGFGDIKVIDSPAAQVGGEIRDEEAHYEICEECKGQGKITNITL